MMSLKDQIMTDIKTAMKAKEADKLSSLRMLSSEIKNKEIEIRPETITDQDILGVLKKAVKKRKDAAEQYTSAGRQDLADKELQEIAYYDVYLPEQMSADKVEAIVKEVIAEVKPTGMQQMGQIMKAVLDKTQGQADNKIVSQLVKDTLSSL